MFNGSPATKRSVNPKDKEMLSITGWKRDIILRDTMKRMISLLPGFTDIMIRAVSKSLWFPSLDFLSFTLFTSLSLSILFVAPLSLPSV